MKTLFLKALRKGFNTPILNNFLFNNVYIWLGLDKHITRLINPYVLSYKPDASKSLQEIAGYSNTPEINEVIAKIRSYVHEVKREHIPPGGAVLDLGCGPGMYLSDFVGDYKIHGLDISPYLVEIAQREYPNGEFFTGDFLDFDFGTRTFDFISCHGMLLYINRSELDFFFRKIASLLRSGGVFVLTYPHATTWEDTVYSDIKYISYSPALVDKVAARHLNKVKHQSVLLEKFIGKYDKDPFKSKNATTNKTYRNSTVYIGQRK